MGEMFEARQPSADGPSLQIGADVSSPAEANETMQRKCGLPGKMSRPCLVP
jgi:hypothetical protein